MILTTFSLDGSRAVHSTPTDQGGHVLSYCSVTTDVCGATPTASHDQLVQIKRYSLAAVALTQLYNYYARLVCVRFESRRGNNDHGCSVATMITTIHDKSVATSNAFEMITTNSDLFRRLKHGSHAPPIHRHLVEGVAVRGGPSEA